MDENKTKNSNLFIVVLVLVMLVLIGLIALVLVTQSNDSNNQSVTDNTQIENQTTSQEEKELDINSDLVQNLSKTINESPWEQVFTNYEDKMAFANLKIDYKDIETKIDGVEYIAYAEASDLEKEFKNLFGPDVEYKNISFNNGIPYYYDNETNRYYISQTFGVDAPITSYFELAKATQKGEIIDLYFYDYSTSPADTDEELESVKNSEIIESNDNMYTIEEVYSSDGKLNESKLKEEINKLKQEGKIAMYKITFTKQSDGNYYMNKGEWK